MTYLTKQIKLSTQSNTANADVELFEQQIVPT